MVRVIVWWIGLAIGLGIIAAALINVAYSRATYLFVVMPIGGLLLFPAAYAANRWLSPALGRLVRRG